jgi:hypothetical protein
VRLGGHRQIRHCCKQRVTLSSNWCVQLATEVDRAASFERELRKGAALASQMVEVEAENTKLTDLLSALEDELSALRNEAPTGTRPPASVPGGTAIHRPGPYGLSWLQAAASLRDFSARHSRIEGELEADLRCGSPVFA